MGWLPGKRAIMERTGGGFEVKKACSKAPDWTSAMAHRGSGKR